LNDLADKPEFRDFVEREFPNQASEWLGGGEGRRTFLKIMGASMALAGLASCRRWPEEKLAPYAHRPANRMDGVPVHYATAFERGGLGYGVLAVSFDGRPIKVDGNPSHPLTQGRSDMFLQASILDVYDPDRSRGVVKGGAGKALKRSNWEEFEKEVRAKLPEGQAAGLVVLAEASRSPSVARLRADLMRAGAKWFEYEAISNDNQREGARRYFGKPLRAVPRLDQANVIVSVDADLFHGEPLSIMYNRDFAARRKLRDAAKFSEATMNRLYVLESGFSITGSMADHRRGFKPSEIPGIASALLVGVSGTGEAKFNAPKDVGEFFEKLVGEFKANPGKVVVVAGYRQPPEVHAAVAAINTALNAPVEYYVENEDPRAADAMWPTHAKQLADFAAAVGANSTVLLLGVNPALTAPELKLSDVLAKAALTIHAGAYRDETAALATWHVPLSHYLEAWGDVRTFDGTVSVAQPLIEPIFESKSTIELLSLLLGKNQQGDEIVKETAKADYLRGITDWNWKKALVEGVVPNSAWPKAAVAPNAAAIPVIINAAANLGAGAGLELALYAGAAWDGRFSNNGWLIELPDPMTRVSWESPLILSPATAKQLDVDSDSVVKIKSPGGADLEAAVFVLPGHPDGVASLAVGYGRAIGSVADGDGTNKGIGVNAYAFRNSQQLLLTSGFSVEKFGDKTRIVACVQDHHTVDTVGKKRLNTLVPELVVEGTFAAYKAKPALGTRKLVSLSIFNEHSYEKGQPWVMAKWGMAIDLTVCTGCSACVIACQAENNIPIVGKQMVYRGREMHWLRIDRYFKFGWDEKTKSHEGNLKDGVLLGTDVEPNHVQAVHQPVLCMHCENAPCEEVCPVAATTHSHEGLNMMTYNRCIGTRYCSNNCPYKVRRFNFFDYNAGQTHGKDQNLYTPNLIRDELNDLVRMQKNPQVTVRSRGIMEKCTYCVQRIENARINLLAQNRRDADKAQFKDGSVVTACQQACPTDAIVFGDLNDKESRVAKLHALQQSYGLLDAELNTKPRTAYLAKVRNNAAGLDEVLYNDHMASEGWKFQEKPELEMHHE
jgi:molybdopterin-containing oxidoreductase family iron-sulfur binding subunit